jgi:tetratricopeptide (TPR) repeat protein
MAEKKNNSSSEEKKQSSSTTGKKTDSSSILFGLIGLALGFVVGLMLTNYWNSQGSTPGMAGKPAAVKGDEPLPAGHPSINQAGADDEVKAAKEFGEKNQDYDSQLKVGGFLYAEARKLEDAKPFFLKAHELKPDEFEPIVQLGNIAFDQAQETNAPKLMVEAADWYEKALKIKPDEINVRTDLGNTYLLRQPPDYNTALKLYEQTLATDPKHIPTLYNKTRALIGMKNFPAAEETFTILKDAKPSQEVITQLQSEMDKAKSSNQVPIPSH